MATVTLQKTFGAYYTDERVARSIVQWAVRSPTDTVLDPSCGDGVFLASAHDQLRSMGSRKPLVWGIDIDGGAIQTVKARLSGCRLVQNDFFSVGRESIPSFDVVIGNPPFIRYQTFNGQKRSSALARAHEAGVNLGQLSSSWAPFLVHATSFLEKGGRLGMVVPVELGHAQYAREVLQFLLKKFGRIQVRIFRNKLFPELSEDTSLLLCEDFGVACSWFAVVILRSINGEDTHHQIVQPVDIEALRSGKVRLNRYLLAPKVRHLYEELSQQPGVARLGTAADVGIGYVTGCNDYFHLSLRECRQWGIPASYLRPAVLSLAGIEGVVLRKLDWRRLVRRSEKCFLLAIPSLAERKLPLSLQAYLRHGQALGVTKRFKCRVRDSWFSVPHIRVADAFLSYMSGQGPRLVSNRANLVAPNTLHLLRIDKGWKPEVIISGWHSSLTRLSCEIEGHALGGGMLKLEPSEAESVLIALPSPSEAAALVQDTDKMLREKNHESATELLDRRVLRRRLGLSATECLLLREAAEDMRKWRLHQ
jgi:adenine-specific DNA-methyltransferase